MVTRLFQRFSIFITSATLVACAGSYAKKIQATENAFYHGDIDTAVSTITPLAQDSTARDRLLYYMEAGIIYRAKGDLSTSNEIFSRAAEMADSIKTSISDSAKAFLLSDREGEFQGENFERAFIRYYLALNQVLQGDLAAAKRTLRKLDADLKDMKYDDVAYKQILIARYLDALVSEELKEYNDARVQYKNLENFGVDTAWLNRERYTLAARAKDRADMAKYVSFKPDTLLPSSEDPTSEKIGELVLICETGKAAVKESRGKLLTDEQFMIPLRISIDIAVLSDGKGMSTAGIIAMMGTAENPIPRFVERDALPLPSIQIGGAAIPGFRELTNFDNMAQKNFNDNYSSYINKNVASIATKIVLAAVAAEAVSSAIRKNTNDNLIGALGGLAVGIGAGAGVAATVKPDLRSWHTLPTGFSATRLFLPAGKYPLQVDGDSEAVVVYGKPALEVEIQPHKKTFVALRLFKKQ